MFGQNPRKQIRKNIRYLEQQKAILNERVKHFQEKINALHQLSHSGTNEECLAEAERFSEYAWNAFPEL